MNHLSMKKIGVTMILAANVLVLGFWAGIYWNAHYGPLPDVSHVEAFKVCNTELDPPQECGRKMLDRNNGWAEDEWELRDRRIAQ
jgi:hypothetical protein